MRDTGQPAFSWNTPPDEFVRFQPAIDISEQNGDAYGAVLTGGSGFEWSSYGRSHQSKKVHVRFHESICAAESTRSCVTLSTRRLNACPTDAPHGAGST